MAKIKNCLLVGMMFLFLLPIVSHAAVVSLEQNYVLKTGAAVAENLYLLAGEQASLIGNVSRDAAILSRHLTAEGRVGGDLLSLAGLAELSGAVIGDLRLLAGNTELKGSVSGDTFAAAGELEITEDARLAGATFLAAGRLTIDGELAGALSAAGGDVVINGRVRGPVTLWAEQVTLGPKAVIDGDFTYRSPRPAVLAEGAVIRGKTDFQSVNDSPVFSRESFAALFSTWRVAMLLGSILVIFFLFKFAPRALRSSVTAALAHPVRSFFLGLAIFLFFPLLVGILLVSVVGIPLGFLFGLAYVQALILARVVIGALLGVFIFKLVSRAKEIDLSWQALLAGPGILFVIAHVPVLGNLVVGIGFCLMLGALAHLLWYALVNVTQ